jgi:small-conductance mechanosensitive channel
LVDQAADIRHIQEIIAAAMLTDKRILIKPEPIVGVQQLTEVGLELKVRCWVKTSDYGSVFHQGQQAIIEALRTAQIAFAKS